MTLRAKCLLLAFFVCVLFSMPARAQTINAASCNASDVQAALNLVAADGTTVVIPAGTCVWATTGASAVTYNQVYSTVIQGQTTVSCTGTAGTSSYTCTATDNTIIVDNVNHSNNGDQPDLAINLAAGKTFRQTGLTFTQNGSSVESYNGGAESIGGPAGANAVRIDHNHWKGINALAFATYGLWNGVFDHNVGDGTSGSGWRDHADTYGYQDWNNPTALGTNTQGWRYHENNQYNGFSNDSIDGGRLVYRFNTWTPGATSATEPLQTHGTGSDTGQDRGGRGLEVYQNYFTSPSYTVDTMIEWTSGTGIIWGNTQVGSWSNFFRFAYNRECAPGVCGANTGYTIAAPPNGWGYCGSQYSGPSAWDQNSPSTTGHLCLDQPGAGQSDLLTGTFPNTCDSTTGCTTYNGTWPNQASEPIYEWSDTPASGVTYTGNDSGPVVAQNRDFYLWCNSASASGCTSFNGTVGVGSGSFSAMPSTCTTGVAYWATDQGSWNTSGSGGQGELFKCTSTNTWTLFYTPYTYPHPLTLGSGSSSAPQPPTNLAASVQ
jgi:hypothetical protein